MDRSGKTYLVSGGASGLGEATCRRLAAEGANVGVLDRDEERGKAIAAELGDKTEFFYIDATDEERYVCRDICIVLFWLEKFYVFVLFVFVLGLCFCCGMRFVFRVLRVCITRCLGDTIGRCCGEDGGILGGAIPVMAEAKRRIHFFY